ncbi:MAG: carboxylesterase, partial [Myxococcota bacterium]
MKNYISGAGPFEIGTGRRGVLLVHGFTGTPFEMRPLGDGLAAAGYRVACPALAGHATRWEDLEETGWRD